MCCDNYRSVATAFISDDKTWRKSMRLAVKEDDHILTPMRMLIEHMPGYIMSVCMHVVL